MKKIDIYLLKEIIPPTILGVFVFTIIVIAQQLFKISDLIISGGVPPMEILKLIFFSLPAFLEISIPVSVILGVTIAFSRLSIDSEIVALRSSGIGLTRLLPPVAIFSLVAFMAVSYLTLYGSAKGYENLYSTIRRIFYYGSREIIKEGVFTRLTGTTLIYVDHQPPGGKEMKGVVISEKRDLLEPILIIAERGKRAENNRSLILSDGTMVQKLKGDDVQRVITFKRLKLNIAGKNGGGGVRSKKPKEIPVLRIASMALARKIPAEKIPSYLFSMNKRLSLPFACIAFALFAVPAGLGQRSRSRSSSFLVTGGIVFAYYIFFGIAQSLKNYSIALSIATLWLPNFLFAILSVKIILKLERDPLFSERFGRIRWRKG